MAPPVNAGLANATLTTRPASRGPPYGAGADADALAAGIRFIPSIRQPGAPLAAAPISARASVAVRGRLVETPAAALRLQHRSTLGYPGRRPGDVAVARAGISLRTTRGPAAGLPSLLQRVPQAERRGYHSPEKPERKDWKAPRLPAQRQQRAVADAPPQVPPFYRDITEVLGPGLREIQLLDISRTATDSLLVEIAAGQLPQLQTLICARSPDVTDQGVLSFVGGMLDRPWDTQAALSFLAGNLEAPSEAAPCPQLREVDITLCPGTTYLMTLALRRLLPTLRCIRRMPVWMTGDNETPFAGKGKLVEVHHYWADGSFKFQRSEPGESQGFVQQLQERDHGVVCEALQYIDYDSEGEWPAFAEHCYRPGIAVKRVDWVEDGREDDGSFPPSLFVWEACDGIRAPANFRASVDKQVVPPGKIVVVRRDGSKVAGADPDDDHPGCLVLSHMMAKPLANGDEMPPESVVQANIRYLLQHWGDGTLDEAAAESLIHKELEGNPRDDAVWKQGQVVPAQA